MLHITNISIGSQLDLIYNDLETMRKLSSKGNIVTNECGIFAVGNFNLEEYLSSRLQRGATSGGVVLGHQTPHCLSSEGS